MNHPLVYQLHHEIKHHFSSLTTGQAQGLFLLCLGICLEQQCQIRRLAEGLSHWGSPNTLRQRFKRWLSDARLSVPVLCAAWIGWVSHSFPSVRPVLLVDETKLGDRLGILLVSWAYRGRAIPLYWRCYRANSAADYPQQGQVLLVYGLLAHVLSALPPTARPLVQMDRGLGHSAAMLHMLNHLGVSYLVRVKSTARFTSRRGHSQLLRHLLKQNEPIRLSGTLFARDHAIKGHVWLIWEAGQKEAWCLFTNEKRLSGGLYAWRWWQEESFKDLKSGGWQWHEMAIVCPQRASRLLLAMAIAYGWMMSLGTQLEHQSPDVQQSMSTADERQRLSLFRLGRRWFKCLMQQGHRLPHLAVLCFRGPSLGTAPC
jgi:hypothetical protein